MCVCMCVLAWLRVDQACLCNTRGGNMRPPPTRRLLLFITVRMGLRWMEVST